MIPCFQTLNTRNHDTGSKPQKRTLHSTWQLFRDFLFKGEKWHSLEPQLFEEILFTFQITLGTSRSTKCCKFKNAWICDYYTAKKTPKIKASLQLCLVLSSVSFKKEAIKCDQKLVLIDWSCNDSHSTVFPHSFSWSIITQHKPHGFMPCFKYQHAERYRAWKTGTRRTKGHR